MRFMIFVKATQTSESGAMPSQELIEAMGKYNQELIASGIMHDGGGLQPSSQGARVTFSGKDRIVLMGPFSNTGELVPDSGWREVGQPCQVNAVNLTPLREARESTLRER